MSFSEDMKRAMYLSRKEEAKKRGKQREEWRVCFLQ